jgi:hypothetical protein
MLHAYSSCNPTSRAQTYAKVLYDICTIYASRRLLLQYHDMHISSVIYITSLTENARSVNVCHNVCRKEGLETTHHGTVFFWST